MNKAYPAILLVLLISCEKGFNGDDLVIKEQELPVFKEIELHSVFNVYLVQDSIYSIRITGNSDFVEQTDIIVTDGVLRIENMYNMKWLRPRDNKVTLYITADSLRKISAVQTCYIETVNPIRSDEFGIILMSKLNQAKLELNCNKFYYWNSFPCGGRLTLTGSANWLKISNCALMAVDASDLYAESAAVKNSSKGICRIRVHNRLEYSICGEGDIYLYGTPNEVIAGEITSSGKLVYK